MKRQSEEDQKEQPPLQEPPDDEDYKAALRTTRELEARVAFLEAEIPLPVRRFDDWHNRRHTP